MDRHALAQRTLEDVCRAAALGNMSASVAQCMTDSAAVLAPLLDLGPESTAAAACGGLCGDVVHSNPGDGTLKCELCKAVFALVVKVFPLLHLTEQGLLNMLLDVCTLLPRRLKTQCDEIMTMYISNVYAVLSGQVSPAMDCYTAHMC